jgi:hypothetical protein
MTWPWRTPVLLGAAALIGLALAAATLERKSLPHPPATPAPRPLTPARPPTVTPAPPHVRENAIDRQDRTTARQRQREAAAFDRRPLLSHLPLRLAGITIAIAGLADDERTTILSLNAGPRSRADALALYRRALTVYDDPGRAYRLRWQR